MPQETNIDGLDRKEWLAKFLDVPPEALDSRLEEYREYVNPSAYEVVCMYFGIGRSKINIPGIALQASVSTSYIVQLKERGLQTLKYLCGLEKAPADPLQQTFLQFFNPIRAKRAGIKNFQASRILGCLKNYFNVPDEPPTEMQWLIEVMTERVLMRTPNFSQKSLEQVRKMLATAGLSIKRL